MAAALRAPIVSKPHSKTQSSSNPSFESPKPPNKLVLSNCMSRRGVLMGVVVGLSMKKVDFAYGMDWRMVAPDQTIEEAESGVKEHAQALINVKELIELESWNDAQRALRKSSSSLKQDIYTIIQEKPTSERPLLRKLYFNLFNNVTKLDYAARNKDAAEVQKCYDNIVEAIDDILSRI